MYEKMMEEINRRHEMELLDQHFPGKSCGNTRCENLCRNVCAAAIRLRMSPEELVDHAIQKEIIPHCGCEKSVALSDKKSNSQNYPNKGKPIPGCRFGYTYGSHPPKTDDQIAAQKRSSARWEKTKERAANAVQAAQTSVETVLAPPATGEMVGGVKAAAQIITEMPYHAASTKALARELEKKTGEDMAEYYWQINDCLSKEDFKRLLAIKGKLKRRLQELEKKDK